MVFLCLCRQLFYQELVGKAKERAAREEAKKAEARDEFTRLLRHTKSLKLDSTWEDIKPDLETHSAYKDVSTCQLPLTICYGDDALCTTDAVMNSNSSTCCQELPTPSALELELSVLQRGNSLAASA